MRTVGELTKYEYDHGYSEVEKLNPDDPKNMTYIIPLKWVHETLGIKKSFRAWFKELRDAGFEEDVDYFCKRLTEAGTFRSVKVWYATLEMAIDIYKTTDTESSRKMAKFYTEYKDAITAAILRSLEERLTKIENKVNDYIHRGNHR